MTKLKVIAGVFGLLALVGCATPNTAPEEAAPARQAQNLEIYAQPEETPVFYLSWCMDDSDSNTGNQAFPDTWQDVLAPAAVADALTFTSDDWQLMSTSLPQCGGSGRQVGFIDLAKATAWSTYLLDTAGIGSKIEVVSWVWGRRW